MVKATLRWVTNPHLKANQKLIGYLNGKHIRSEDFLTPYVVERKGHSSLTVYKKYVWVMGSLTEYFYEIEAEDDVLQDLCGRMRQVSYSPLSISYLGDMSDVEITGVMNILLPLIRKIYYGSASNVMSGTKIDRILFERYKNPNYIVFKPVVKQLLNEEYDVLKEYRARLPNPIGTIAKYFQYPSEDNGTSYITPIYLSEDLLADVRSKINIEDLISYTLLAKTSMPFHILEDWATEHDYNIETALSCIKSVGPDDDIVVVKNQVVYKEPESIFWDIRDRGLVKENEGWFVLHIPEVQLAGEGLRLFKEIATRFHFRYQTTYIRPDEIIFKAPPRSEYVFGFDTKKWLIQTCKNIYDELPPIATIEGRWNFLSQLRLSAEDLAKVAYAAFRGYSKVLEENDLLADFTSLITVNPDFSVSLPAYDLEEVKIIKNEMEAILSSPDLIHVTICKDLESCVAARIKTSTEIPNSIPFSMIIGDQYILASNSKHALAKPKEFGNLLKDIEPFDPSVQGFYNFESAKGSVERIPPPIEIKKGVIKVDESDGRWYASVDLREKGNIKTVDLIDVKVPQDKKTTSKMKVDHFMESVEDLWRSGWFLTDWGRNIYRKREEISTYFLSNIASLKINTFEEFLKSLEGDQN